MTHDELREQIAQEIMAHADATKATITKSDLSAAIYGAYTVAAEIARGMI